MQNVINGGTPNSSFSGSPSSTPSLYDATQPPSYPGFAPTSGVPSFGAVTPDAGGGSDGGFDTTTLLIIAGVGVAAYFLVK